MRKPLSIIHYPVEMQNFILFILTISVIAVSCRKETPEAGKTNILISEPLQNRTIDDGRKQKHDKNCLGFYTTHFPPSAIDMSHFRKDKIALLNKSTGIKWRAFSINDSVINFTHLFNDNINKVVYVAELIESDRPETKILSIGSDDGIMLWVNGDSILTVHRGRAVRRNDDFAEVSLRKGKNVFLYKIDQGDGDWGLYRRLMSGESLNSFYQHNTALVYSDIAETCILPDKARYLPLRPDSRRKLDNVHTIKVSWKKFDYGIIHVESYSPSRIQDRIKLPDLFDGKALFEICIIDSNGNIDYKEEIPIFYQSVSDSLFEKLTKIKFSSPIGIARRDAVIKMWSTNKNREYSTRMKANVLLGLYRYHNISTDSIPLQSGPQIWGYQSELDNTIQPYRVIIPASYRDDVRYPVTFVMHGLLDKDMDFLESDEGGSHYHTAWRTALSTENQRIIVMPHGRGIQNYLGNAIEELPIIIKQLKVNWNIDTTRISIFTWSKGARNVLQLMVNQHLPIETIALCQPIIIEDETRLYSLLLRVKSIYPDLKWYIRHGMNDTVAPIHLSRKLDEYLKMMSFEVDYKEMPHSNHFSHLIDPEREFYKTENSRRLATKSQSHENDSEIDKNLKTKQKRM